MSLDDPKQLGCEGCARYRDQLTAMTVDLQNLEVDLRVQRRVAAALKAEMTRRDREEISQAEVEEVFEHWQRVFGKQRSRLGEERQKKIRARIREGHSVEELKWAVDGCHGDAWWQGENSRGYRCEDVADILRNEKRVDRFLELRDEQRVRRAAV